VLNSANFVDEQGRTPFTFRQNDLCMDFFSYSSLTLAGKNPTQLLDPEILAKTAQTVWSTFFKSFIALPNGYNGYWAWQEMGASLPPGLGSTVTWGPTSDLNPYTTTAEVTVYPYSTSLMLLTTTTVITERGSLATYTTLTTSPVDVTFATIVSTTTESYAYGPPPDPIAAFPDDAKQRISLEGQGRKLTISNIQHKL
jgi:hypothetical protein